MSAIRPRERAVPRMPPTTVMSSASSTNGSITCRSFAPSAILTPISRVLSFTTANMMLATPMPPTRRVSAPMIPRKIWMPERDVVVDALHLPGVPDAERARVLGVEVVLGAHHPVDLGLGHVPELEAHRLVDEVVDLLVRVHGLEGRARDGGLVPVRPVVHPHLHLLLGHPHHQEDRLVDLDGRAPPRPRCRRGPGPAPPRGRRPGASRPRRARSGSGPRAGDGCCASRRTPAPLRERAR